MAKKPTEAAKALLAEAAQDYAAHHSPERGAQWTENQAMANINAQRGAGRLWSTPPESRNGGGE
jgi:hypothetical protein